MSYILASIIDGYHLFMFNIFSPLGLKLMSPKITRLASKHAIKHAEFIRDYKPEAWAAHPNLEENYEKLKSIVAKSTGTSMHL